MKRHVLIVVAAILAFVQHGVVAAGSSEWPSYWIPTSSIDSVLFTISEESHRFGGVAYDYNTRTYVIGVPAGRDLTAARSVAFRGTAYGQTPHPDSVEVAFRPVQYSLGHLNGLVNDIAKRVDASSTIREALAQWYVDERTNSVRIGVTDEGHSVGTELKQIYGSAVDVFVTERPITAVKRISASQPIQVRPVNESPKTLIAPYPSRFLDRQPFSTAHRVFAIFDNAYWECTTAFQNYPATHVYSAGHCFPQGATVYQGYYDIVDRTAWYTQILGTVASVQWGNGRIDAESIQVTAPITARQHTGNSPIDYITTAYTGRIVLSTTNRFCANGSVTGIACEGEVVSTNVCINVDDGSGTIIRICGLSYGRSVSNTRMVQPGDSGGPVIRNHLVAGAAVGGIISSTNQAGTDVYFTPQAAACSQTAPFTCE